MKEGNSDAQQVLKNIRDEKCLDDATEREFFERIREAGQPTSALEGRVIASRAVSSEKDPNDGDLFCKGERVPSDRFLKISRLITAAGVRYLDEEFADQSGLALSSLELSTPEELQDIVQAWETRAASIGRPGGIAWVAEEDSSTQSALPLAMKLGLPHLVDAIRKQGCAVLVTFDRQQLTEALHVPV